MSTASPSTPAPVSPEVRLGRRVAAALYWLVVAYLIGFGAKSVIERVFFPVAPSGTVAPGHDCTSGVGALFDELREFERTDARPDHGAWASWDARFIALGTRCDGPDRARYRSLDRLRQRVESGRERAMREQADLRRELTSSSPSSPRTE